MLRFAHISDLHFARPNLNPTQLFSKRWLGNLNFVLKRRRAFEYTQRLPALVELFKKEQVSHVMISGDLSITAHPEEFKLASDFTHGLQDAGFTVVAVPGNHDHYTRYSYKQKSFYRYFPPQFDEHATWNLKEHKVTAQLIRPHLWVVALDTATPTSLFSAQGLFSEQIEVHLCQALSEIPKGDSIVLINHFPFFQNDRVKNRLMRGEALRALIEKYPNILLYLHGHTHRQIVADLRANRLPIISDPGSAPEMNRGACHLIQLDQDKVQIDVFRWVQEWQCVNRHRFSR